MISLCNATAYAAMLALARDADHVVASPDLSAPPLAGPGKRSSGRRGSGGERFLGPPETAAEIRAVGAAQAKRDRRLGRNRQVNWGTLA